jgi:rhodanese-related sulfurtransferase
MKSAVLKKLTACLAVALLAASLTSAAAIAADAPTEKPDWFFHNLVDVQFVMDHIKIPMPEDVMLIDARPFRPKYVNGHIPMAVSIPDSKFDKMTDKLPKNKDALLIFYCGGTKCKLSHKSARKAEALGYTNVRVFPKGYPGYMKVAGNYAAVDTAWVKKQVDAGADMVLADSRPKRKKYDKGHIPTAVSIPDMQFDKFKDRLPADQNRLVVFYCGGFKCKLSHKSARKAIDLGYKNVKVYAAGYPAWKAASGGAQTASAPPAIKAGSEEGSIDIAYFRELMTAKPDSVYLIDVRDADEFATGSMTNAVNIPVDDLEAKIKTLPADKPVVFICGTGARSGESFYMVQDLRPELKNVYYIDAEMTFKKDGSYTITKPAG